MRISHYVQAFQYWTSLRKYHGITQYIMVQEKVDQCRILYNLNNIAVLLFIQYIA